MTDPRIAELNNAVVNLDEVVHDNEVHLKALSVLYKDLEDRILRLEHKVRVIENKPAIL